MSDRRTADNPGHEGSNLARAMKRVPNTTQTPISRVAHGKRNRTQGVVLHTTEGTAQSAISWFDNPQAGGVGAHLVIGKTQAWQLADLDAMCWHAVGANSAYVGIEHEGYAAWPKWRWLTRRKQRKLSANRVGYICWAYGLGLPTRGRNVFGHVDFPKGGHHDPGVGFWCGDLYMKAARRAYRNLVKSGGTRWSAA